MSWLRLDDGFVEHDKIHDLSDRAFRLHVAALCYCARNLTDGELNQRRLKVVCALTKATRKHVTELVDSGLWTTSIDGHSIRDSLDYNPSAETVKKRRAEAKERMANLRGSSERSHERDSERDSERSHTPDPGPSQTQNRTPKEQDPADVRDFLPVLKDPTTLHTLGAGRDQAYAHLLTRISGADPHTPKVIQGLCRKLPADRIEGVAAKFSRRCVPAGVVVNALKAAYRDYELELQPRIVTTSKKRRENLHSN